MRMKHTKGDNAQGFWTHYHPCRHLGLLSEIPISFSHATHVHWLTRSTMVIDGSTTALPAWILLQLELDRFS
jgi:hypothetical protein